MEENKKDFKLIVIQYPTGLTIKLSPTRGINIIEVNESGIRLG